MKTCSVCKQNKPLDEFYNSKQTKDGKGYRCKSCDYKARKKWTENNPERSRQSTRARNLKFKYNITIQDYEELLAKQDYKCGICGSTENNISKDYNTFSVDHDHQTGVVRGLLCNQCNRGLGMLGDTIESLENALDYLKNSN